LLPGNGEQRLEVLHEDVGRREPLAQPQSDSAEPDGELYYRNWTRQRVRDAPDAEHRSPVCARLASRNDGETTPPIGDQIHTTAPQLKGAVECAISLRKSCDGRAVDRDELKVVDGMGIVAGHPPANRHAPRCDQEGRVLVRHTDQEPIRTHAAEHHDADQGRLSWRESIARDIEREPTH
jgi:hypothetical protein